MKRCFKIIGLILLSTFLSGCNADKNDNVDGEVSKYVTVYSKDDYDFIEKQIGKQYRVNIKDKVEVSSSINFTVSSINILTEDSDCKVISQDDESFVLMTDTNKVCDYEYFINSIDSNTEFVGKTSGISRVVVSDNVEQAELTPFGYVAYQGQEAEIDVGKELEKVGDFTDLDGYTLDSAVLSTNSNAQVQLNTENNIIEYTPAPNFLGSEPVMYSMKNENGDVLAGTVIVTVADEVRSGIDIQNKIVIKDPVDVSEITTVDLTPYVTNSDDDWQLIYINSFDAMVNLTNPDDLNNKTFDFVAEHVGDFYVNVVATDHHGGFDVSLIRISVQDPNAAATWNDIVQDLNVFKAALTLSEAQSQGIQFSSANTDTVGTTVAEFNFSQASQLCKLVGRLPTEDELLSLYTNSKPIQQGWPVDVPYWTNDVNTVFNLSTGVSKNSGNNFYYLTCIVEGGFEILPEESSAGSIVANGIEQGKVVVQLSLNNQPVEEQPISASIIDDSKAQLDESMVYTDSTGKASFYVTDTKAETVTLSFNYNGEERVTKLDFIGDVNTAVLSLMDDLGDEFPVLNGGLVGAHLLDAFDNPVVGQEVTFSTSNTLAQVISPSITDDKGEAVTSVTYLDETITSSVEVGVTAAFEEQSVTKPITFIPCTDLSCNRIDIFDTGSGKLFTNSPSVAYLDRLDDGIDTNSTNTETGKMGPAGVFYKFDLNNASKLCTSYNTHSLGGRTNWHLATYDELVNLYDRFGNMFTARGWPVSVVYWTSTQYDSNRWRFMWLTDGTSNGIANPSFWAYVSCVSNP